MFFLVTFCWFHPGASPGNPQGRGRAACAVQLEEFLGQGPRSGGAGSHEARVVHVANLDYVYIYILYTRKIIYIYIQYIITALT